MDRQLTGEALKKILQIEDIKQIPLSQLIEFFQAEKGLSDFIPDGICQVDPRNGERILYNSARARRPHDNRPADLASGPPERECVICQGKTTGVLDVAELSEGFTFINKNLFPSLYPLETGALKNALDLPGVGAGEQPPAMDDPGPRGIPAYGLHFVQWTSSLHNRDWHNMPPADRLVVMNRLAVLEKTLLTGAAGKMPANQSWGDRADSYGFVSIFKNFGRLVGGSLVHGHQQIGFSNIMPCHFRNHWRFEMERGEPFSAYLRRENPANLLLKDYGPAVLLVPYFMRRPFDMMLLLKETGRRYLHELTAVEMAAIADGWHDAIRVIHRVMPEIGRETAYNVISNNGPGAGLYFEFLPYTQEIGGFEHLGLFLCQQNPQNTAARIRRLLTQ